MYHKIYSKCCAVPTPGLGSHTLILRAPRLSLSSGEHWRHRLYLKSLHKGRKNPAPRLSNESLVSFGKLQICLSFVWTSSLLWVPILFESPIPHQAPSDSPIVPMAVMGSRDRWLHPDPFRRCVFMLCSETFFFFFFLSIVILNLFTRGGTQIHSCLWSMCV